MYLLEPEFWFAVVTALTISHGHPQQVDIWLHHRYYSEQACFENAGALEKALLPKPGVTVTIVCKEGHPI